MTLRKPLTCCAFCLAITGNLPASAQVAAESAQVLSGVSTQGNASRRLGSAISGSINRAGRSIDDQPNARRGPSSHQGHTLPEGGNDLKDTGAATYRTGNAGAITVSGRFIRSEATACVENCEGEDVGETPQP